MVAHLVAVIFACSLPTQVCNFVAQDHVFVTPARCETARKKLDKDEVKLPLASRLGLQMPWMVKTVCIEKDSLDQIQSVFKAQEQVRKNRAEAGLGDGPDVVDKIPAVEARY